MAATTSPIPLQQKLRQCLQRHRPDLENFQRGKRSVAPRIRPAITLAVARNHGYFGSVTQAIAHILKEVEQLSEAEQRELRRALADRLPLSNEIDPEVDEAWKPEIRRRLEELENGKVEAVPGDAVSQRISKIVGR